MPTKIATHAQALRDAPDSCGAYSLVSWVDETGQVLRSQRARRSRRTTLERLAYGNFLACGSNLIARRADVVAVGGWDGSTPAAEDWDLVLRLVLRTGADLVRVDDRLVGYRVSGASMSSNIDAMEASSRAVLDRHAPALGLTPRDLAEAEARIVLYSGLLVAQHRGSHWRRDVLRHCRVAVAHSPLLVRRELLWAVLGAVVWPGLLPSRSVAGGSQADHHRSEHHVAANDIGPARRSLVCQYDINDPVLVRSASFEVLDDTGGHSFASVLVRHGTVPLAKLLVPIDGTPSELAASIRDRCEALTSALPSDPVALAETPPPLSVVVTTHGAAQRLERLLRGIAAQRHHDVETIVVDNAPGASDVRGVVERARCDGLTVRLIEVHRNGLSAARNAGARSASFGLIGFLDDDVIVDPNWAGQMASALSGEVDVVSGLILPSELDTEAQVLLERHGSYSKGFTPRTFTLNARSRSTWQPGQYGSGANLGMTRAAFDRLGGFARHLGVGTPARGGEDLDLFFRAEEAGLTVRYDPTALVWHPHRRTISSLRRQAFDYGIGLSATMTNWVAVRPSTLLLLVGALVPRAREARRRSGADDHRYPKHLIVIESVGTALGPFELVRSLLARRWQGASAEQAW